MRQILAAQRENVDPISAMMVDRLFGHARERAGYIRAMDVSEHVVDGRRLYRIGHHFLDDGTQNIELTVNGWMFPEVEDPEDTWGATSQVFYRAIL